MAYGLTDSETLKSRHRGRVEDLAPLAPEKAKQIIAEASRRYKAMGRYTRESADRIAAALFDELTLPFREHPVVLSRISGIGSVTLWKWRTGRTPIDVETISRKCDRLARALGLRLGLAEEAANLLAGIPWRGKRTGSRLMRYAAAHGLDAASLFHLARRQERMNASQFAARLGVTQPVFARVSAPPDCDKEYAMCRASLQLTSMARRFGLAEQDEIAAFRLLLTSGTASPRISQGQLADAFLNDAASKPRSVFMRRFLRMLKERHGLPRRASIADAIWAQASRSDSTSAAAMDVRFFKRRLFNISKARHGCLSLPDVWAEAMARFAFPSERETKLRLALARYLKNRG
jgi:hypothetical protein